MSPNVRERVTVEVEKGYRAAERAAVAVKVARQALEARRDAERISGGQVSGGFVLVSNAREASANRLAAESTLLDAELSAMIARAELARAVGGAASNTP